MKCGLIPKNLKGRSYSIFFPSALARSAISAFFGKLGLKYRKFWAVLSLKEQSRTGFSESSPLKLYIQERFGFRAYSALTIQATSDCHFASTRTTGDLHSAST